MMVNYQSFLDELSAIESERLEKDAGVRDALYTALTGRVPLYHGTSKTLAKNILEEGLKPGASRGISDVLGLKDAEKGLAFLTRSPYEARTYAHQAEGLRRLPKVRELLKKHVPSLSEPVEFALKENPQSEKFFGILSGLPPGGKKAIRANVPRSVIREAEGSIPELVANPNIGEAMRAMKNIHPELENLIPLQYGKTITLKGGVPTKYLEESSDYVRPGLSEIKENLRSAVKDPKSYGKDVLRSLTGYSHRPSTIMRNAKAGQS